MFQERELQAAQYNRFDFEQQILKCWGVTTDINDVYKHFYEKEKIDNDELANVLLGLETLYNIRFEEVFSMFEKCIAREHLLQKKLEEAQLEAALYKNKVENTPQKTFSEK
jgi:hypothetical protein